MTKLNKIYILGHAGAGTTTLSKILSEKLKIPCYDMDDVRFIKKFTKARTPLQRKKIVDKLLKKKKWIFDSRGTAWDRHAMNEADLIIWLRPPGLKRCWRIMKRYFERRKDSKFNETFWGALLVVRYTLRFRFGIRHTSLKPLKEFLDKNNLHPIIIRNNSQLRNEVKKLK